MDDTSPGNAGKEPGYCQKESATGADHYSIYSEIPATPLLVCLFGGLICGIVLSDWLGIPSDHIMMDLLTDLLMFGGTGLLLVLSILRKGSSAAFNLTDVPRDVKWVVWGGLAVLLLLFSVGSVTSVLYPLAILWPNWVEEVLLVEPSYAGLNPGLSGLLRASSVLLSILVAPVIEEAIFRGVLLGRLKRKLGLTRAIIISSLIFGVLHVDMIGGTVFGLVMGCLYLERRNLWVPTSCHALHNGLVLIIDGLASAKGFHFDTASDIVTWGRFGFLGLTAVLPLGMYVRRQSHLWSSDGYTSRANPRRLG